MGLEIRLGIQIKDSDWGRLLGLGWDRKLGICVESRIGIGDRIAERIEISRN